MIHPTTFELPTHDKLTDLLAQPYFRHLLREQVIPAAVAGEEPLALAMIDIDEFLAINRDHGHVCGDRVLEGMARLLRETLPDSALLCRYSGDEFAALLPATRLDDAFTLLDAYRRRVAETVFDTAPCSGVHATCSIGLSALHANADDDVELLRAADHALYIAKLTGRNKVSLPLQDDHMVTKTSHYTATQLKRLRALAESVHKPEATLLREALDDLLKKYNDLLKQRPADGA